MTINPTPHAPDHHPHFADQPESQHLAPGVVLWHMASEGAKRAMTLGIGRVLVLSMLAGAFITAGAIFSLLIASGVEADGPKRLLEGFGFSMGFFLVIMTGSLLFTEVNVEMPAAIMSGHARSLGPAVVKLWGLAAVGNFAGAFLVGQLFNYAHSLDQVTFELLLEVTESKLRYREVGGIDGFVQAMVSGMLGNWLVGMAAFVALMGRTIIGKFVPIVLVVSAFVASGFLHSPANMAFFSLVEPTGAGPGWSAAIGWSILPAAIGNVLGAALLVALPFWYAGTNTPGIEHQ